MKTLQSEIISQLDTIEYMQPGKCYKKGINGYASAANIVLHYNKQ